MILDQIVTPPIVVSDANVYQLLDIGSKGWLTRLAISGTEGVTVDVYNRAFDWTNYHADAGLSVAGIRNIKADSAGKLKIQCDIALPLTAGDLVQLASTSVGGYDTTFRVTSRDPLSRDTVVLAGNYSTAPTDLSAATLTLAIPSAEYNLYRVLDRLTLPAAAATTVLFDEAGGVDLINGDNWPSSDRKNYPMYLKFSGTGTFRVAANIVRPTYV